MALCEGRKWGRVKEIVNEAGKKVKNSSKEGKEEGQKERAIKGKKGRRKECWISLDAKERSREGGRKDCRGKEGKERGRKKN